MLKIKHLVRSFSIWLYHRTNYWVVPKKIVTLIAEEKFCEAREMLDKQELVWCMDPELTTVITLMSFLEGKD